MIRALVIDLDGTLINRSETISGRVKQAVDQVAKKIPVSIATGREMAHVVDFARQLALTSPQICDGGAMVLDPVTAITTWCNPLEPADAERVVRRLHESEVPFMATYPGGSATEIGGLIDWNLIRVSALDISEEMAGEITARFHDNADTQAVKVYLPYNDLWAVDFTRRGVDKAAAVAILSDMIKVDLGQMTAAGDSYNDLPLLQACGLAIAMGDAPEELKAIADYIAPTAEEDGLAVAIEEFILPRL
ncbi:MAG: Cof-type HAD-IIB family hydrolase [Dehalococcoidia bacterium]|nr:Cof-type HAD-IIB family hydrolase [Dehalococcoidia bacterium]